MKRTKPPARRAIKNHMPAPKAATPARIAVFADTVWTCRSCGYDWGVELHHVVYQQELRKRGGNPSDGRNALALCRDCHAAHHNRSRPLPLEVLRDENYEYARELLGAGVAYEYLVRRYVGEDIRLAALLDEWHTDRRAA